MSIPSERSYIMAEIGTSHQGDIDKAKKLVDAAKKAGADCVKFQWVYADEILHPDTGIVNLPTGAIRLYDRFRELEVRPVFFKKMRDYAHENGLDFSCSPFGLKSLKQLFRLKPDSIKIASPELNHFPMLKELVRLEMELPEDARIPVIVSSGVSKMEDIEKTLAVLEPVRKENIILLHCVTSYPAPETEYNLAVLKTLSERFGVRPGVSDHSLDPVLVPAFSVAAGGSVIEKHITLSRDTDGLDDPVALPPGLFSEMSAAVRRLDLLPEDQRLDVLSEEYGEEMTDAMMGSGEKALAPSEEQNYTRTNRSIHYMKAFKAGHKIRRRDIAVLRTEKVLTPGISPEFFDDVVGKRLKTDVTAGAGLLFEHLER
ncbi:MAG: N-acetylneuraminate synthase family protein [Treponema sp.]|nr:N-acetylneuraminate synthase family protein [Candidatus Treponema caballi]